MLLKALQEANAKIESLETRIAALEDRKYTKVALRYSYGL